MAKQVIVGARRRAGPRAGTRRPGAVAEPLVLREERPATGAGRGRGGANGGGLQGPAGRRAGPLRPAPLGARRGLQRVSTAATVRQYEIWWASLPPPVGRRPVLLLSRDSAYAVLNKVIVAEVTSTLRDIPVEVTAGTEGGPGATLGGQPRQRPRCGARRPRLEDRGARALPGKRSQAGAGLRARLARAQVRRRRGARRT